MALDPNQIASDMIGRAGAIAGKTWQTIQSSVKIELTGLAHRLVLIVEAVATGELTAAEAQSHFATMKFHVIATIAMATVVTEAAISQIVNAAIGAVKTAVNSAAGFSLIA